MIVGRGGMNSCRPDSRCWPSYAPPTRSASCTSTSPPPTQPGVRLQVRGGRKAAGSGRAVGLLVCVLPAMVSAGVVSRFHRSSGCTRGGRDGGVGGAVRWAFAHSAAMISAPRRKSARNAATPHSSERVKRVLLNGLTLLSLLLCLASTALLVRSYRIGDWITHQRVMSNQLGTVRARDWRWRAVRAASVWRSRALP